MHGTGEQLSRSDFDLVQDYSKYSSDNLRLAECYSDEDTEDASETDMIKEEEYRGMKEMVYQDKLITLRTQLQMLKDGAHPEYERRMRKLELTFKERVRLNEICHKYELECIERDYQNEKKSALREFEEKKVELKENLIFELEEKKKIVEMERLNMDFTGELIMDVKPITTRKLRRRPNDPVPIPEKRRKSSPAQLNYLLEDQQILEDLKALNKGKIYTPKKISEYETSLSSDIMLDDCKIEDGKLIYEKRCYQRGHSIYVESKETGRISAVISNLGSNEVWVRKATDHSKLRIPIIQLQKGKYVIRRKSP